MKGVFWMIVGLGALVVGQAKGYWRKYSKYLGPATSRHAHA